MKLTIAIALLQVSFVACSSDNTSGVSRTSESVDIAAHAETVKTWRVDRLARLKAPGGYLNLAGLFWLPDGKSSFGADSANDFIFPGSAARIGEFEPANGGIQMTVENGVDVRIDDRRVESVFMPDDLSDQLVTATFESLSWTVINRDGKLAVRLRDLEHPALVAFPPIPYFNVEYDWRVTATLRRYEEPKIMNVNTVIEGLGWNPISPGIVEFDYGGERFTLEAYESGERLFFVFGDATSGGETYPAGRFLYAEMPGEDGRTILDFNLSYNPPCAFNDFSTCPVASPRNRLRIAVEAGEKFESTLHVGAQL
ncbi:MAG: DUF1684 domain-containing protein [Gammaproteobacteria bacterium]|nr:DUF1684 domain-containing protein [Gammaproteobacteria bacterium]